ncbi:ABC transporter ATP-binding protein [Brevibacillus daliensis]|uniref:ABC transporter ATP-binding protein n=1 Tax=Brevibacillus daliensis TaxID=2892995 RepID=UPI001E2F484C|nr:ABC transporter ATP-binding protein [Brevibacillus daliensis]
MLTIEHVTGGYPPRLVVTKDVSFQVDPGKIVGLIGLNGAGKSTIIKQILGILRPFSGEIRLNGKTLQQDPVQFRSHLSYIPEVPQFYQELTLWEHLQFTALAYGLTTEELEYRGNDLLERFRMTKKKNEFPSTFSKGMQQKVMILCAFLVERPYLIVDEPFVGLDPLAIDALVELMKERREAGTGILVSTHILTMAEKYCDEFILFHEGMIRYKGSMEDIQKQSGKTGASLEDIFIGVVKE